MDELEDLENAEYKEAFELFDKVRKKERFKCKLRN
jgi:hypothetical protein